tara:strand:+ start:386 stop:595 length:210 start_codon:yes stop_codon:yes gene_type:complete
LLKALLAGCTARYPLFPASSDLRHGGVKDEFNAVLAGIVDMKSMIAGRIVVAALRTLAAIGEMQKSRRT